MRETVKKWITLTDYIDVETGEIIRKDLAEREYNISKKIEKPKIEENEKYIIRRYSKHCTRNRQQRLEI